VTRVDWAALIVATLLGGIVLGWLMTDIYWSRRTDRDRDEAERQFESQRLRDREEHAHEAMMRSLGAHTSLRARLTGMAGSAGEYAAVLERLHEDGETPDNVRANADWRPPRELRSDLPRPGRPQAWQALDRSFEALLATLDDPDATFARFAASYRAVGKAAGGIADALAGASEAELAAGCSFCGKSRQKVKVLIAAPGAYMCDQCTALCVEILQEQHGEGWREDALRRHGEDEHEGGVG
jgi:hypothetical protein